MLGERDMKVASTTFPLRRPLYDPAHIEGRVDAVKEGMRLAARLKCRVLTLRIGRTPDESAKDDVVRLLGSLNDLARLGSHLGITVAVTTSGDSPETLRKLVQSVADGLVAIDLDPAGCVSAQLNPVDVLKVLHSHIVHVQARDAVRDLETGGREVPLGRGETPWDEVIAILADARYDGWMTVRRTSGNDIPGDLARGVAYLRNVAGGF
jgi:sugar phosphate isomerase/epimerase